MPPTYSLGQRFQVIRWLAENAEEGASLVPVIEELQDATGIEDKWAAIKRGGDIVVPIITSCPLYTASAGPQLANEAELEAKIAELEAAGAFENFNAAASMRAGRLLDKFKGDGTFFKVIVENLPAILSFIKGISEMFPKGV